MLWLIELLQLFSLKYSPSQLLNTYFIKKNLQSLIQEMLVKSARFAVENRQLVFESIDYRVE
jgi:hypothetical protein